MSIDERQQWNARHLYCSPSCLTIFTFFLPAPAAGGAASSSSSRAVSRADSTARVTLQRPRIEALFCIRNLGRTRLPCWKSPVGCGAADRTGSSHVNGSPSEAFAGVLYSPTMTSHTAYWTALVYRTHIFVRYRIWVLSHANPKPAHYLAE